MVIKLTLKDGNKIHAIRLLSYFSYHYFCLLVFTRDNFINAAKIVDQTFANKHIFFMQIFCLRK